MTFAAAICVVFIYKLSQKFLFFQVLQITNWEVLFGRDCELNKSPFKNQQLLGFKEPIDIIVPGLWFIILSYL